MTKIADPYSRDLMQEFRQRHATQLAGNAGWWWSCSCGVGSRSIAATQGIASAALDRHLRAAHRRFITEKEATR